MTNKAKYLPYFNTKEREREKEIANFFLKKFKPSLKTQTPLQTISSIQTFSKTHPYFLRFDIKLFFPSINHDVLIKKLPEIFTKISQKRPSRNFLKCVKELPLFLEKSPYKKGIPIGAKLSYALCNIFLLDLDIAIKDPFLRHTDDYLVFLKKKTDAEKFLKEILFPKLEELDLEINVKKLKSGRFHQEKMSFLGFDYYAGYFSVSEEKVLIFKQKIKETTYLTKKKSVKTVVKTLNNKILGFGHYYKFCSSKKTFQDLDSFTRMRLRRYLSKNKTQKNKHANIILTNEFLEKIGLKSLEKIQNGILKKRKEKVKKSEKPFLNNYDLLEKKGHVYEQKVILEYLKELTKTTKKIEKRLMFLEKREKEKNIFKKVKFFKTFFSKPKG